MKLIGRYIFRRMAATLLMTLLALSAMVWLSLALRDFNLITDQGQTIAVFLDVTLLLLPALIIVVAPVALLVAVVYTFTTLNNDAELVVINASGARPMTLLRPVLILGIIATLAIAAMTLYFSPLSLRSWRTVVANVHSTILSSVLRDGEFMSIANGLTFQIRKRKNDGTLEGIFVSDARDPNGTLTYLAERGVIYQSPIGDFMVMNNGTIQRRSVAEKTISIIEFTSYAIDLSTFSSAAATPTLGPGEQETGYLLHPDPQDKLLQQYPGKFVAELHDRITAPLYALLFAVVPLVFLAQAETTRQSRAVSLSSAVWVAVALRTAGMFMRGIVEENPSAFPVMYAIPVGFSALAILLVLTGVQPRPPEWVVVFTEWLFARFGGATAAAAAPAAGSRG